MACRRSAVRSRLAPPLSGTRVFTPRQRGSPGHAIGVGADNDRSPSTFVKALVRDIGGAVERDVAAYGVGKIEGLRRRRARVGIPS